MKRHQTFPYVVAGITALTTFLVYLPALRNGFVKIDDTPYILNNPHIRSINSEFFLWAMFKFYTANWHPLTWFSHALDYALWGLNPLGHHLTNILLHAVNTALVVLLALKLLEIARARSLQNGFTPFLNDWTTLIAAAVTGLLFGIHPVHVESVAWVAERKDVLCALFFLLSIMAYVKAAMRMGHGAEGKKLPLSALLSALCFFVLALLSKPMAVTLPLVLLILDWYPLGRIGPLKTFWTMVVEKTLFIFLSLASSIITILAQRAGEALSSLEAVPLPMRLLVAVKAFATYLGKMLLPLSLVPYYPYPPNATLGSFEYVFALGIVVGLSVACVILAKKQRAWLALWGYYVVTLIPVIGIVQVGGQAMADRYTYLPSLAPFLFAGVCAAWILKKANSFPWHRRFGMLADTAVALIVMGLLAYITVQQIGVWKNTYVLWDHVIIQGYESATAYNNRGVSFDEMERYDEAIADFEKALAADPRNYFAYNNIGMIYGKLGQYPLSIDYFLKAISINPQHADSYCNLGLSYFNLHKNENALESYDKAIDLKPDFDAAYLNRGNLLFIMGNRGQALADYRKACDLGNNKACELLTMAAGE